MKIELKTMKKSWRSLDYKMAGRPKKTQETRFNGFNFTEVCILEEALEMRVEELQRSNDTEKQLLLDVLTLWAESNKIVVEEVKE